MVARVNTVAFHGINVLEIDVQVHMASGLPAFTIVGLPDKAVAESRERVRAALATLGLALPPQRITVNLAPADLIALINHFKGSQVLSPPVPRLDEGPVSYPDLKDIKGQETAKRALEVVAAGGHNMLMIGPPGAGKSMLAQRLAGLLPPLDPAEALEVGMIHSLAGMLT